MSSARIALPETFVSVTIAGPNARAVLEKLTDADVSQNGMRFMAFKEINIGLAPVWCGRVTFTGDLGYEFWMPARYQRYVYEVLREAGTEFGLQMFGLHALNSLRLVLGSLLGIADDLDSDLADEAVADSPDHQLYAWTGWLLEWTVAALSAHE